MSTLVWADSGPVMAQNCEFGVPFIMDGLARCLWCERVLVGQEEDVCTVCIDADWQTWRDADTSENIDFLYGVNGMITSRFVREMYELPAEGAD